MLRRCSRLIALAVMLVGLPTAQAADETLTLACQGTLISQWGGGPKSSERINMGIIVDLQKRTVIGLEPTVPLTIDQITETEISFLGSAGSAWSMSGTLDKITGSLVASSARFALAMDLSSNAGSRVTSCTKTR
jgi:hypothetical protein